jgi:hypothetical protein
VDGEQSKERALPRRAELEGPLAVPHLEGTKDPKLEHVVFVTPASTANKRR